MKYRELSPNDLRTLILDRIREAEKQHLDADVNARVNAAAGAQLSPGDQKAELEKTVAGWRAKQAALAAGIAALRKEFADVLALPEEPSRDRNPSTATKPRRKTR